MLRRGHRETLEPAMQPEVHPTAEPSPITRETRLNGVFSSSSRITRTVEVEGTDVTINPISLDRVFVTVSRTHCRGCGRALTDDRVYMEFNGKLTVGEAIDQLMAIHCRQCQEALKLGLIEHEITNALGKLYKVITIIEASMTGDANPDSEPPAAPQDLDAYIVWYRDKRDVYELQQKTGVLKLKCMFWTLIRQPIGSDRGSYYRDEEYWSPTWIYDFDVNTKERLEQLRTRLSEVVSVVLRTDGAITKFSAITIPSLEKLEENISYLPNLRSWHAARQAHQAKLANSG